MTEENLRIASLGRRMSVLEGKKASYVNPFKPLGPFLFILAPLGMIWFFNAFAGVLVAWVPLYISEHFSKGGGHDMKDVYIAGIGK